jgi:hypothetical protein
MTMESDLRKWMQLVETVGSMRDEKLLCESADPFIDALTGTILSIRSPEQFGGATQVMKLASGNWQKVHSTGGYKGIELFELGDDVVDRVTLHLALQENRVGLVLQGIAPGDRIASGIQVLALPLGAVVGNPHYRAMLIDQGVDIQQANSKTTYRRGPDGMLSTDQKLLPPSAFTPENAVWER